MSDENIAHNDPHVHDVKNWDTPIGHHGGLVWAIETLLINKRICSGRDIQRQIAAVTRRSGADGAKVVARAWVDTGFKARLVSTPMAAVEELGYNLNVTLGELRVVENTNRIHHLVVCTLCSCYPTTLLGRPPDWYKSLAYRSRAVIDPRGVMRGFGLDLGNHVQVKVVDSTADCRYMVLPLRPSGTDNMREVELANLVTRDSLIGVTQPLTPEQKVTSA